MKLKVFLNMYGCRQEVGLLHQDKQRIFFEYAPEFLKSGIELSPFKLPLKAGVFEEKDCYIISVQGKTKKENYIEIFPKTVYEQLVDEFVVKTSFCENSGLKGRMKSLKGERNEERRREN